MGLPGHLAFTRANAYYQRRRAIGDGREAALRRLANKLLGQLHHCLGPQGALRRGQSLDAAHPGAEHAA
jgi:hypothetical protein